MIDYGKVAYDRLKQIEGNNQVDMELSKYVNTCTLSATNNIIEFRLKGYENVIVDVLLSINANYEVYKDDVLQMLSKDKERASFVIKLSGDNIVKFKFNNINLLDATISILGKFLLKDTCNNCMNTDGNNLGVITTKEDGFYVTNGDINTSLYNYHNNVGTQVVGEYLCSNYCPNFTYMYKANNCIKVVSDTEIIIPYINSTSYAIFNSNSADVAFGVAYVNNSKININTYNSNGNIVHTYSDLEVYNVRNIVSIDSVVNTVDDDIYFVITDLNQRYFIILCKFRNNGSTADISNGLHITDNNIKNILKVGDDTFQYSAQLNGKSKIVNCNINFASNLVSVNNTKVFDNANLVCAIADNRCILDYDNSLIDYVVG